MNADDLMRMHVEALFTHDARGDLLRVNEPNGAPAPRFFLGQTPAGLVLRFRGDVREETRQELAAAASLEIVNDLPTTPETYREILASTAPIENTWSGPAFSFPNTLPADDESILITDANAHYLQAHLSGWLGEVHTCAPLMAVVVDGAAVAICGSVRATDRACEAGVETIPSSRGRGYAGQVVAAWARAIRAAGKTPLYSTSWHNDASRDVARKLGLTQFGTDLHIT
jgi:RimJ/RimL family protein N-acetyltransferase